MSSEVVLRRRFDRGKALGFDLGPRLGHKASVPGKKRARQEGASNVTLGPACCDGKPDKLGGVKVGKFPVDQAKCKKKGTKKNKQKVVLKVGKQLSTHNWAV